MDSPADLQSVHVDRDVVDLRLVFPASVALVTVLGLGVLGVESRAALGVVAATASVACGLVLVAWSPQPEKAEQLRIVAVCALVVAVLAGLGVAQAQAAARHSLHSADPQRATVTMVVDAIPRTTGDGGVVVSGTIRHAARGSSGWRMRSAAVLFARGDAWLWLEPGTTVRAVMTIAPSSTTFVEDEFVLTPLGKPEVIAEPVGLHAFARHVRGSLARSAERLPSPSNALLPSMVLGDQRRVPPELGAAFRDSGLSHLAAVSGANIAYVIAGAAWLAGWCGAGRRARYAACAVATGLFVVVVGPEASVIRAAAMAAIAMYAVGTGRSRQSLSLLAAVVLVVAVVAPSMARSLGFLLSCAATAGIVACARPAERRLARLGKTVAQLVALALVAHLATAPVLLAAGRPPSPWGVVANVLVAPVVPLVTVAGTAAAAVGGLVPPLGRVLAWPTVPALWWIAAVARTVGGGG